MPMALFVVLLMYATPVFANGEFCQEIKEKLQPADILFTDINEYLFKKVAESTKTWTSHVGVAFFEENQWWIYESVDPVSKRTPLCEFLKKTTENHVAIRRMKKAPTNEQLAELKGYMRNNLGRKYHFGFDYSSKKLFCSKFVYQAFKKVFNIEIGEIKSLKQLLAENPNGSTLFWRLYFFGFVPWDRLTVTPKDQLYDKDLATVWTWEKQQESIL